jgi:KUP system potassium uptake protein
VLGIYHIAQEPHVLYALSPHHAFGFFLHHGWAGMIILGAVVLAITGGEALYADMGHFGKRAIRLAWFSLVLPALLLNYFGQGALLLRDNATVENPFYLMLPGWLQLPMVGLATAATIIASQAVISGAFSLTRQAIQLDYCPRLEVIYTSAKHRGQIYMPFVNWTLFVAVVALVLFFQSSGGLASAYGLAVTATMLIDTILVLVVACGLWHWPKPALLLLVLLALIDVAFLSATSLKIFDGGWFPLLIGVAVYTLFSTWRRGREYLRKRRREEAIEVDALLDSIVRGVSQRVPGTAVFFTGTPQLLPRSLLHNLKHNKVLHERVVLLTLRVLDVPRVKLSKRVQTEALRHGFYRVIVSYGFKDRMHMPLALRRCDSPELPFEPLATSYFFSRDTVIVERSGPFARWRQHLFAAMLRLSLGPNSYLHIPNNQVLELGAQVRL